jgi:hypothetical protein
MSTAREGKFDPSAMLAVSWFDHRRTRELCARLGIEVIFLIAPYRGLRRYLQLTARTLALLARRRPAVLLVQNPSLVLSALALAVRWLFGYRLVVDAHNEAVVPLRIHEGWIRRISRWVIRYAQLTIVNAQLGKSSRQGGRAFVLPDAIPSVPPGIARESVRVQRGPDRDVREGRAIGAIFEAVRGADLSFTSPAISACWRRKDAARAPRRSLYRLPRRAGLLGSAAWVRCDN